MSKIKLKWVHQFVDRRNGGAKARYYFRRGGKRFPLPGLPGSPEFMAAYGTALAGKIEAPPIGANRTKPGSMAALIALYLASPKFLAKAPGTQAAYRYTLERMRIEHGDKPVADLERQHIEAMLAKKVTKTPTAANFWLSRIKVLMSLAVKHGMRSDNPAADIERIEVRSEGFHTWTEAEIEQYETRHPVGTKARLALALLLHTAQRRSDVVRMGRKHIRADVVDVRQQKTGKLVPIPMHPELARILAATPPAITPTFLMTAFGKPFTSAGFGKWFRERCDEAGLPRVCAAHGLRKAACRRLAEAGCSANVIASISGHTTLREVERYTKAADQERMARMGMAALANFGRTKIGNGE